MRLLTYVVRLVLFVSVLALNSLAQNKSGELQIEVTDPVGAGLEASGRLENLANGTARTFSTNSQGVVTLSNLQRGRYRLSVSRSGFPTQSVLIEVKSEGLLSIVGMSLRPCLEHLRDSPFTWTACG